MRSTLPLRSIRLRHVLREPSSWVHQMPVVADLRERGRLEFPSPVTVLSGENGVGKSTLLEALALKLGFGATGGRLDDPFKQLSTGTAPPRWSRPRPSPRSRSSSPIPTGPWTSCWGSSFSSF